MTVKQQIAAINKQLKGLNVTQSRTANNLRKQIDSLLSGNISIPKPPNISIPAPPKVSFYFGKEVNSRNLTTAKKRVRKENPSLPQTSRKFQNKVKAELEIIQIEKTHHIAKGAKPYSKPVKNIPLTKPEYSGKFKWIVKLVFLLGTTSQGTKVFDNPEYVIIINKKKLTDFQVKKQAMDFFVEDITDTQYKGQLYKLHSITIISISKYRTK
jgi:hypothetical protein